MTPEAISELQKPLDALFARAIPEPNSGCWLWTGSDNGAGYGTLSRGPHRYAHRAAYAAKYGAIPHGLHLDHLCRVRCCINPDHLEPVTNAVNASRGNAGHHMKNGGARLVGRNHPRAVLSEEEVRRIRKMAGEGKTHLAIADHFEISPATVGQIVRRVTWRHI